MRNNLLTFAAVALATVVSTQAFAQDITPDQRPLGEQSFSHETQSNYGGDASAFDITPDRRPLGEGLARSGNAGANGPMIDLTPDHRPLGQ
jgi:hypothetical protein